MMKRFVTAILGLVFVAPNAVAEQLPPTDVRNGWKCAYPFSETNCQTILLHWTKDRGIPVESVFNGSECSGCISKYFTDPMGNQHLIYSTCTNRFGARFTCQDFIAPINRYKESEGNSLGWNIVDWQFIKCFETWQCSDFCSLNSNPPYCLKYQAENWGYHVPVLQEICSFGNGAPNLPPPPTTGPPSSTNEPETIERDSTWEPVY